MKLTEAQLKVLAKWPEAPQTWAQKVLHAVDVFEDEPDEMVVLRATSGLYADGPWTGIRLGDLRSVADLIRWNEEDYPGKLE